MKLLWLTKFLFSEALDYVKIGKRLELYNIIISEFFFIIFLNKNIDLRVIEAIIRVTN